MLGAEEPDQSAEVSHRPDGRRAPGEVRPVPGIGKVLSDLTDDRLAGLGPRDFPGLGRVRRAVNQVLDGLYVGQRLEEPAALVAVRDVALGDRLHSREDLFGRARQFHSQFPPGFLDGEEVAAVGLLEGDPLPVWVLVADPPHGLVSSFRHVKHLALTPRVIVADAARHEESVTLLRHRGPREKRGRPPGESRAPEGRGGGWGIYFDFFFLTAQKARRAL